MNNTFLFWAQEFLKLKKGEGIGHSRLIGIQQNLNHLSSLNSRAINNINFIDIQTIINNLHLSKKTLTEVKSTATAVFELAINCRAADFNPAKMAKVPKSAPKTDRCGISYTQQHWVIDFPHRAQLPAMIMMFAGLRRGEVTALQWADIDLNEKTISVNKSVEFIRNQPVLKSPKTSAGNRVIDIPDILVDFLKDYLKSNYSSSEFVIHLSGKPDKMLTAQAWRKLWSSYMDDLNVKYGGAIKFSPNKCWAIDKFTPHQLRHTYASLLYEAGVDAMTAQYYLGHADISTTLNIYTHLSHQHRRRQAGKLDVYLNTNFEG